MFYEEAPAAITLSTKPSCQHKSKVEVLEIAAVLIKQIYSIDKLLVYYSCTHVK